MLGDRSLPTRKLNRLEKRTVAPTCTVVLLVGGGSKKPGRPLLGNGPAGQHVRFQCLCQLQVAALAATLALLAAVGHAAAARAILADACAALAATAAITHIATGLRRDVGHDSHRGEGHHGPQNKTSHGKAPWKKKRNE